MKRRPDPDVGDPQLAVPNRLRVHDLPVLREAQGCWPLASAHAARNSGITLVALGIGILVLGIVYHVQFMVRLRHVRHEMTEGGLIHGESVFPPSLTLVTAVVLLMVGIGVIASMIFSIGPFG
jgi:putative membrane protein